MKKFLLLLALLPSLALADAPVIWSGTTAKWLPAGLKSAGMCKLSASGVMTSGQADLTSNVTGILPMANGGTAKNMTPVAGGLVYADADSLEVTAAGTTGRAVISGGTGAPTFFAPTVGAVLFAGASGILAADSTKLFYDDANNRFGVGTNAPSYAMQLSIDADDYTRGFLICHGLSGAGVTNSCYRFYTDYTNNVFSLANPAQTTVAFSTDHLGRVGLSAGPYNGGGAVNIQGNTGRTADHTLLLKNLGSQTGDGLRHVDSDGSTVLSKIDAAGAATFSDVTDSGLTASTVPYADSGKKLVSSAVTPAELGYVAGVTSALQTQLNAKQATLSTSAAVSNQFVTGFTAPDTFTRAQPAFTNISGSVAASQMPALTGDVTTSAGAVATTLATVNSNVGSFTNANITVNAKGLITAASNGSAGGGVISVLTKTADYTVLSGDFSTGGELLLLCNKATAVVITLPAASNSGLKLFVKNIGAGTCTVVRASSDTIDGDTSLILPGGGSPRPANILVSNGGTLWSVF